MSESAVSLYRPPEMNPVVEPDFLNSTDLEQVEAGIVMAEKVVGLGKIYQGIGIVKIERDGLWIQAGFKNLRAYRIEQAARLSLAPSTIADLRRIGEAWLDNQKELSKFSLDTHVSKLAYFNKAVHLHGDKKGVIEAFKSSTFKQFRAFAKPDRKPDIAEVDATFKGNTLLIDGVEVLKVGNIGGDERSFVLSVLKKAYTARRGNLIPCVLAVYDEGEARAMQSALKKYRANK